MSTLTPRKKVTYREILRLRSRLRFQDRTKTFAETVRAERSDGRDALLFREVQSPTGRQVSVAHGGAPGRDMLMFGSNNYLGLATHPKVVERVREAVLRYGVGAGGPPILNGHGPLHRRLEARLAEREGRQAALVFSSGYAANVGLMSALPGPRDLVLYDDEIHASALDGLKLGRIEARAFAHNDCGDLERHLTAAEGFRDVFVAVEGVYSMSGDVAPLDHIGALCRRHDAHLILDEAHGTGVTGPNGAGTLALFDAADAAAVVMGTFSKALGVSGGFVAADHGVIELLRYSARAYVFSAAPSTALCAAVLAALDVMDEEPEIHRRLRDNLEYLAAGLRGLGFDASDVTAVFTLPVPAGLDIRAMAHDFHRRGLFLNQVEAPAVPLSRQRFRVSVTAEHTRDDLDRLLEGVREVWAAHVPGGLDFCAQPS